MFTAIVRLILDESQDDACAMLWAQTDARPIAPRRLSSELDQFSMRTTSLWWYALSFGLPHNGSPDGHR